MTAPRQVLSGTTYLITRRCANRRFLLLPSDESKHAFEYCLARASRIHGVQIHAYCAMSNHYHLVLTDVGGNLPDFMEYFNRLLSMCLKSLHKWEENIWSNRRYNAVELPSFEAVVDKMMYTVVNPVAAGLVRNIQRWPGALGYALSKGCAGKKLSCPKMFFRRDNPNNKVEELILYRPEDAVQQQEYNSQKWDEAFEERLRARQFEIRKSLKRQGRGFMGVVRVKKESPYKRAERQKGEVWREEPKVATRGDRGLWKQMKERVKQFRKSYREAYERWRTQKQSTFPAGTWWVVKVAGAKREEMHADWRMCYG